VQETLGAVSAAFEANQGAWGVATGHDDAGVARQHARVLGQWVAANRDEGRRYGAVRDSSMAENIRWILEREGPDARIVVWAHNAHVADAQATHRSDGTSLGGPPPPADVRR
jgi:erythromycin esterase